MSKRECIFPLNISHELLAALRTQGLIICLLYGNHQHSHKKIPVSMIKTEVLNTTLYFYWLDRIQIHNQGVTLASGQTIQNSKVTGSNVPNDKIESIYKML